MSSLEELQDLEQQYQALERKMIEAEANHKTALATLQELGCETPEEASAEIEKIKAENEERRQIIDQAAAEARALLKEVHQAIEGQA